MVISAIVLVLLYIGFFYVKPPLGIFEFDFNEKEVKQNCDVSQKVEYYSYINSQWDRNNKFGLYIYAENRDFFELAQNLVNSNGGDWGYVLIPYNIKDRDISKWKRVFEQLRNKHLIPVIQLWDVDVNNYKDQTREAADFLNRFIWPIRPRYISVYNEMNDAKFWYGNVDPEQYATILDYTIDKFKDVNQNYFMMNGAFNISAPTDGSHIEAFTYLYRMNKKVPGIFDKLDGWASHPYPQPNFSGDPISSGRWSIRAYENELWYLKNTLGVTKNLPVFITETGWAHSEGDEYNFKYYSIETISKYFEVAYKDVWLKDDRVRAVMPFTIKYDPPFDHFSWVNKDNVPYKHYEIIKKMKKVAGNPPSIKVYITEVGGCD